MRRSTADASAVVGSMSLTQAGSETGTIFHIKVNLSVMRCASRLQTSGKSKKKVLFVPLRISA